MERTTRRENRENRRHRGARDWPMTVVLGLALLFSGMPQEIAVAEWAD